jgi:hypothetical protein
MYNITMYAIYNRFEKTDRNKVRITYLREGDMMNKGRAQCLVTKGNKILMVKHNQCGIEYFCLPGGGIRPVV